MNFATFLVYDDVAIDATILDRFARTHNCSRQKANELGKELVKFLMLCATVKEPLVPSREVDEIWHHFILHTKDYSDWCMEVLGKFIHHIPSDGSDRRAYNRTRRLLKENAGSISTQFWPTLTASKCSKCGGKCRA